MTELTTESGVRVELPWDESEPADWNDWLYANFDKKGKGDSGEPYATSEVIYLIKTAVSQIEVLIPLPTGTRTTDDTGAIMSNAKPNCSICHCEIEDATEENRNVTWQLNGQIDAQHTTVYLCIDALMKKVEALEAARKEGE